MQVGTHPYLKLDALVMAEDSLDFEVDAYGGDEGGGEGVVSVSEEERSLADAAVAYDKQLEHVVKVLVSCIFLPLGLALTTCHL